MQFLKPNISIFSSIVLPFTLSVASSCFSVSLNDFRYGESCNDVNRKLPNIKSEILRPAWLNSPNSYLLELSGSGLAGTYTLFCDLETKHLGQRVTSVRFTPNAPIEYSRARKSYGLSKYDSIVDDIEENTFSYIKDELQLICTNSKCSHIEFIDKDLSWDTTEYYPDFVLQDNFKEMQRKDSICVFATGSDTTSLLSSSCDTSSFPVATILDSTGISYFAIWNSKCANGSYPRRSKSNKKIFPDYVLMTWDGVTLLNDEQSDPISEYDENSYLTNIKQSQLQIACSPNRYIVKIPYKKFVNIHRKSETSNK